MLYEVITPDHPFENVFLGWCWTSTSAAINPSYAWYVHLEGGRMFFGHKRQSYLVVITSYSIHYTKLYDILQRAWHDWKNGAL